MNCPGNKQNALNIINFNQPERVEVSVLMKGLFYLGCDHEGYSVISQIDKEANKRHLSIRIRTKLMIIETNSSIQRTEVDNER